LRAIAPMTPRLDVMLEAKMKDSALIQIITDLKQIPGVQFMDQASFLLQDV
jgi:UV DNA damage endonuclease